MYSINTKKRYLKGLYFFILFFVTSSWSEQKITPVPPWLKPELLIHLAAMRMNDSQNMGSEGSEDVLLGLMEL